MKSIIYQLLLTLFLTNFAYHTPMMTTLYTDKDNVHLTVALDQGMGSWEHALVVFSYAFFIFIGLHLLWPGKKSRTDR